MPIGAIVGGAAIGGVATVGAGALGASAQKKAASKAADTSLQVAEKNNALYRDIYNQNKGILQPYANAGLPATAMLNDLLYGTNTYNPASVGATAIAPPTPGPGAAVAGTPIGAGALSPFQQRLVDRFGSESISGDIHTFPGALLRYRARQLEREGATPTPTPSPATAPATPALGSAAPSGALDAFARFREGTNYQWRYNQGLAALDAGAAARGSLDSGAQRQAEITFGQNFASNELANYMDLLARQQAVGLSAASAVAGVGNTYAGSVASSNTAAANAAANAALAKGQATANMWGNVAGLGGQLGGALFQYGLGQTLPGAPTGGMSAYPYGAINVTPGGGASAISAGLGF